MADTRTQIQRRYNEAHLKRIYVQFPIELVDKFKDKCERLGISQASVIREAIEEFLNDPMDEIKFDPGEDTGEE